SGIYHLVNEGSCSWYEFTREIVRLIGASAEVVPVDRGGRTGNMRRPLYSVLQNTKARALGIVLRPWRAGVEGDLRGKEPKGAPGEGWPHLCRRGRTDLVPRVRALVQTV